MSKIVAKFGGSSLASTEQIKKAADIIKQNSDRVVVVCSAPGKRSSDDTKVTDMLYECYNLAAAGNDFSGALIRIEKRFAEIISGLGISFDLAGEMKKISDSLLAKPNKDYLASRGEYLNTRIIAAYLGFDFIEAADYIKFNDLGGFDAENTNKLLSEALASCTHAAIPGFYGSMPDGTVHTFSRGGSDITGSIAARAIQADLYENWTDVSGMLAADPRVVSSPRTIEYITYKELRELSYSGASVLHEDAVFPVRKAGIPINIRNTNRPEDAGTMILPRLPADIKVPVVTGIAGLTGFTSVHIEKSSMNSEVGFIARLLTLFAERGISVEHIPSGIDELTVVADSESLRSCRDLLVSDIKRELDPETIVIENGMALIAVVGQGMVGSRGSAASIFEALAKAGINIRMIDQGAGELNIIVGVDSEDYKAAVRAIYDAMCK